MHKAWNYGETPVTKLSHFECYAVFQVLVNIDDACASFVSDSAEQHNAHILSEAMTLLLPGHAVITLGHGWGITQASRLSDSVDTAVA